MSTIFPGSASVGQIFEGYTFNGTAWDIIGNEFNPTYFSPTPPDNTKAGDLWVDSSSDVPSISPESILTTNDASAIYLTQSNASSTYATKAYADNSSSVAAAALVDSAPSTLNTLNELAAALGDDANFATTITNALSPIGSVTAYALSTPPAGWLLCDGSIYSASAYPTLSVGLGSTYGGNGTTTFAVPNLKGRMPVGLDSTQTEFDALAETGGEKSVTLNSTQIPSHTHPITDPGHAHAHNGTAAANFAGSGGLQGAQTTLPMVIQSNTTGITVNGQSGTVGQSHNNLQPYIVMNYIIRAV